MPEFQRAEPNRQSWSIATIEADRPRQIEIDGMAVAYQFAGSLPTVRRQGPPRRVAPRDRRGLGVYEPGWRWSLHRVDPVRRLTVSRL